jgi:hypothetical protein
MGIVGAITAPGTGWTVREFSGSLPNGFPVVRRPVLAGKDLQEAPRPRGCVAGGRMSKSRLPRPEAAYGLAKSCRGILPSLTAPLLDRSGRRYNQGHRETCSLSFASFQRELGQVCGTK